MAESTERENRRRAAFEVMQERIPLPIRLDDAELPGGARLEDDEFIVRASRDWGIPDTPVALTTQRLVCPIDPSSRRVTSIPLSEIDTVRLRKNMVGFATLFIESGEERKAFFAVHINAARVRADIETMVAFARRPRVVGGSASGTAPGSGDRYDQLRRLGELKASGVLSESEFEQEKARILRNP